MAVLKRSAASKMTAWAARGITTQRAGERRRHRLGEPDRDDGVARAHDHAPGDAHPRGGAEEVVVLRLPLRRPVAALYRSC